MTRRVGIECIRVLVYVLAGGVGVLAQAVKPYLRIETGAHAAAVKSIDIDASERFLVSASDDKTARVWELRSGRLLKVLRPPIGDGNEGALYAVAISPDGGSVAVSGFTGASGSGKNPIYIFDRASGALRTTMDGLPEVLHHLAFSKNGHYLAAGLGRKNGIRIFETAGYSEVARDVDYGDSSNWLEFDQAGRLLTTSYDGFVRLYDARFRLLRKVKPSGGERPYSARFSPDGARIAVGYEDRIAVEVLSGADLSSRFEAKTPTGATNVGFALWSPDGQTLCAAGRYRQSDSVHPILCWDESGKGRRSSFPAAGSTIGDIRALRLGAIAFCSFDGSVGVLERSGTVRWRSSPDLLDYRTGPAVLLASPDTTEIETAAFDFHGKAWKRSALGFSVSDQSLKSPVPHNAFRQGPLTSGLDIKHWEADYHPTLDEKPLALEPYEFSRSLSIGPGKDSFVLGTEWYLRKFDSQGRQLWATSVPGVAWQVNASRDGRFVVAALGDGTIRWYTFEKGQEVLAVFIDRDLRRWVAWNPDGFFNFQNGGDGLIGYQINRGPDHEGEFVKVDQLRNVFYRPDVIAQTLKPEDAAVLVSARNRIGHISKILAGGRPPEIDLISPAVATVDGDYLLQFRVKDAGGGRGRVVLRIDGTEIEGRAAVDVRGTSADVNSRYVPIAGGEHTLSITAYDAKGRIEGPPKTVRLMKSLPPTGLRANLYLVAAGISHYSDNALSEGVRFAAADAELVSARFKEQEGKGLYRKVTAVTLADSRATLKNIRVEIAAAARSVRPGDTFVLYLAGHGLAESGEYYFIPWEAEYTNQKNLLAKSVNREQIQELLKQVPTNKSVLILDTCGAGAILQGRTTLSEKAAIERVAVMSGRAVLAASNSNQMAMDGYQNHGVFTYALLEGLQRADATAEGEILITRLAEYVQSRVPVLTLQKWNYRQAPLSRIEGEPFPIAQKAAR
ncbi:MAG: caspase family protein [Acidobacteriaceae bacterium]|nr:caspase family protein [Acidobacteriaceae bacterium]